MRRVCINRMLAATILAVLVGGAVAVVTPAAAAQKNAMADVGNVTLTSKNVEALIASFPDVKKAGTALAKKYKSGTDGGKTTVDAFSAWLAISAAQGELNGVVTPYGFTDFRQWLDVLVATARAYAFAKDGGDVDAKMAAAIEQIKNNPDIPDAQKKQLLAGIKGAGAVVSTQKPPEVNIAVVTPYMKQLKKVLKN